MATEYLVKEAEQYQKMLLDKYKQNNADDFNNDEDLDD